MGLGALILSGPATDRPIDVFFRDQDPVTSPPTVPGGRLGPERIRERGLAPATCRARTEHRALTATSPRLRSRHRRRCRGHRSSGCAPFPGRNSPRSCSTTSARTRQPRTVFDEDELAELVHSIREIGVLQPVVVRRIPTEAQDGEARSELHHGRTALAPRARRARTSSRRSSRSPRRTTSRETPSWRTSTAVASTPSRRPRRISSCSTTSAARRRSWPPDQPVGVPW